MMEAAPAVVAAPATGFMRWYRLLLTGGMFHIALLYCLVGVVVMQAVLGVEWYWSLVVLAAYWVYVSTVRTERTATPRDDLRAGVDLATLIDHLKLELVIPEDVNLDPEPRAPPPAYVFGVFPHGIHAFGCSAMNFAGNALARRFPRIWKRLSGHVASVIFRIPFLREVMMSHGYRDCSRDVCDSTLAEGRSVMLVVGGEQESIRTRAGTDIVWLHRREGFIRLAMRHGAPLVPVYTFGLTDIFHTATPLQAFREWLVSAAQICIPVFWGEWGLPIPLQRRVTTVVGRPIPVRKLPDGAKADDAEVRGLLDQFAKELADLFETHKAAAGYPPERRLVIIREPESTHHHHHPRHHAKHD